MIRRFVVGLGLLLFVWASPMWAGAAFLRLEAECTARECEPDDGSPQQTVIE
ncbi:MAG: hypothetical protein ACE5OS_07725 [Anaerolineae bacterium]